VHAVNTVDIAEKEIDPNVAYKLNAPPEPVVASAVLTLGRPPVTVVE
jgi:hypothetical protein